MRILILSQFFNPEPSFKGIAFAKELESLGHQVSVLTGFPNYPGGKVYSGYKVRLFQKEVMDGISILRVPLYPSHDRSRIKRSWNYISFCLSSFVALLFIAWKFDVIYVYHPPATVGLSAACASLITRTPFVYDIQDLWPDTLAATGMLNNKIFLAIIGVVCSFVYVRAKRIVVLSEGFKNKLVDRGVPSNKIDVIYNWCDEKSLSQTCDLTEKSLNPDKFNIVFAGNLGPAQDLEVVLRAAKILESANPDIEFVFVGDGISLEGLKAKTEKEEIRNVSFIPRMAVDKVGGILRAARVLLVHLKKDPLFEITIPSKTQAYLAMGRPILMGVEGDGANLINRSGAGVCFKSGDVEDLVRSVLYMSNLEGDKLEAMARNAKNFYFSELSLKRGAENFDRTFRSCL